MELPIAIEFNEVVAMDLKVIEHKLVLHLIDHVTRFSAAAVVKSKKKEEIIQHLLTIWISIFGAPCKFFSDNGGEFSDKDNMELCKAMNITVKKTAAEAPFSNGLCERHYAVLEMFLKTRAEAKSDFLTALQWAVNAKNFFPMFTDFHHFSWYLEEILDYQMFSQTNCLPYKMSLVVS